MKKHHLAKRLFWGALLAGFFCLIFGMAGAFSTWLALKSEVQGKVISVPDLFFKSEAEASQICQSLGLILAVDRTQQVYSQVVPQDKVLLQVPRAGRKIKSGRRVEITLSAGPETKLVPDMVGQTLTFSKTLLDESGMKAAIISRTPSTQKAKGRTLAQIPEPGKTLGVRNGVSLLVSDGEQAPWYMMPKLEGKDYLTVKAFLDRHEFRVITRYRVSDPDLGQVILEQIPKHGYPISKTQTVTLVVNKDF